ncbi:hypothetical protein GCM10011376_01040 [Nocardioides flavus (ex Wang et al. 2016)]|uniref:Uncharacterized protein n=1 Tax=Nocardioides flavus (ex Wang et al. 2016) TaxID=2058780 RepID=A0ABQ3HHE8_9ACTN|nr:hypothetical protein GCM10011376_01040 [Nocardioides flavus (ex Wang et al. 2016)]
MTRFLQQTLGSLPNPTPALTLESTMNRKATRLFVATVALVSLAGFAAPAEAGPVKQVRTGWCC